MPRCYLLTVCSGSALDQHSNNVSIFNLVEQINVPPGAAPPPGGLIPLEIHAYFQLSPLEVGRAFEVRHVLQASTGLETVSESYSHKSVTPRYRTRTLGVPFPPVPDQYQLRVDHRMVGSEEWVRDPLTWPLLVAEVAQRPNVTH